MLAAHPSPLCVGQRYSNGDCPPFSASVPRSQPLATRLAQAGTHVLLGGHKEEGLGGVEEHPHHAAPVLAEWVLRRSLAQLVHQHSLQQAGEWGGLWVLVVFWRGGRHRVRGLHVCSTRIAKHEGDVRTCVLPVGATLAK